MRGRMSQDQFLLKWNNHQNNFVEVFNFLRTQDAFVDVTLACDGKSFSAHKVVLSACSPYFQMLFQTNPCKHPIVFLKDVKGQDMEALIEFIYKGEVSVSQTELGSLISTAENLKIKGLAEPERPIEKSGKRLSSPPRGQNISNVCSGASLQHNPLALFSQSSLSPCAKRKRSDQYTSHCTYTNNRDKEEKIAINANAVIGGENIHSRDSANAVTSQVVLLPSQDNASGGAMSPTDLSPQQSYVSHHPSLATSDGVLYSVAGAAIYVGSSQTGGGTSTRAELVREAYSSGEPFSNGNDETVPGPSGIQISHHNESSMNIKLEPSVSVPNDGWDGSNHSYEDGGTGSDGGGGCGGTPNSNGGIGGSANDAISLSLPLHSELTEAPSLHDSSRVAAARALLRVLGAASSTSSKTVNRINEGINKMGLCIPGLCKICGLSIPRGEHRSHMASHTAHRPLHCAICGRGFHQTEDLKRHIRVHTGEKPYKCSICGVAFRQRGHLSRHIFKYHPGEESPMARAD